MTTQPHNGISKVPFQCAPNSSPPELPEVTLAKKQHDGVAAGYPLHLCHLVQYYWATALPDTPLCREYVDWFLRGPCVPYGICLMKSQDFSQKWGQGMDAAVELAIQSEGCPPLLWTLTSFIENYNVQIGAFFEPKPNATFDVIAAGTWAPSQPPEA